MHDVHCHLDLYNSPPEVALKIERDGIFTVAVTNLPSNYYNAKPHMQRFSHSHLAVGLHPSLVEHHSEAELGMLEQALRETDFVGEIGLDYSFSSQEMRDRQIYSFRSVLRLVQGRPKFISVHSRRAAADVVALLSEFQVSPVVFHWYSGSFATLERLLSQGHYLSINPTMLVSRKGQQIVARVPRDRLLTETDGPFVKTSGRPAVPSDVQLIHRHLSSLWREPLASIDEILDQNLQRCIRLCGLPSTMLHSSGR